MFVEGIEVANIGINTFTDRHIENLRDIMPAATVLIESVAVEVDLARQPQFNCSVDTTFFIDGTFDELDSLLDTAIDSIIAHVGANIGANYDGVGCALQQIVYMSELDPGISAAVLTWSTYYA